MLGPLALSEMLRATERSISHPPRGCPKTPFFESPKEFLVAFSLGFTPLFLIIVKNLASLKSPK